MSQDHRLEAITELSKEFKLHETKYEAAKAAMEKDKDKESDARFEARTHLQRCLGVLIKLKKKYFDYSFEDEKFENYVTKCERKIAELKKELECLGSSMSGIPDTSFDDVAGLEDVKTVIKNYLFALKNPDLAKKYRIETNIGLLLYGPPGTGKTLIAEAIAHELGVRFFMITPSQVFGSYVGESERNIKEIFAELRACEDGAVLLIDECESIFGKRTGDSNRAAIGVANQLLQEMNGAADSANEKRVIIGATNRPQMIDEAYLRYKRFSLHFYIGMPEPPAIKTLLDLKLDKLSCDPLLKGKMYNALTERSNYTSVFDLGIDDIQLNNADFRNKMKNVFEKSSKYTCADVSNIISQCSNLALQEHRICIENGKKVDDVIDLSIEHFNKVMQTFKPSVTPKDILQYMIFEENRSSK